MLKSYQYRIYPTEKQKVLLLKSFGCARWIYNWGLEQKSKAYETTGKCLTLFDLGKYLPALKIQEETKWLKEVNAAALQGALYNLDAAFTRFFNKQNRYPKFKTRKTKNSFSNPQYTYVDFTANRVYIPKFKTDGGIKTKFDRQFEGKIKSSTVSMSKSGNFFISLLVDDGKELPQKAKIEKNKTIGIDLGIKTYATLSDGTKIDNPKHLKQHLDKIRLRSKQVSHKVKGSNNRNKARIKLAKAYERVANIRKDFLHKLTSSLIENQDWTSYAIEDLSVKDMLENNSKAMSKEIGDASWYEFRRQLTYKADWAGKTVLVIGRFDPSSKMCTCGYINRELTLADRKWQCVKCGSKHDRDVLAANNIKHFAFCTQNTYNNSVGQVLPEFTLGENPAEESMNQEAE